MAKPNGQQVGRAGEHFVAAELHRRGAYAVMFVGNMQRIDMLATDRDQQRVVSIQVKTKGSGSRDWQTQTTRGRQRAEPTEEESSFWVFVDLRADPPEFYVVPEWWIENNIYTTHAAYLAGHGGARPVSANSTHHSIPKERLAEWHDRWDLLGIT